MSWVRGLRELGHRLRAAVASRREERELDEEIRFHLEAEAEARRLRGLNEAEARRAALVSFGGVDKAKEACREERGLPWLETTWRDVRWAVRTLRKSPAFSLGVTLVLALAIGATTAIFTVVHGVLVEPLPLADPERLVALWESNEERGWDRANASAANLLDLRERAASFSAVTAHNGWIDGWGLAETGEGAGSAERVAGVEVMGNFFDVLGVETILGRGHSQAAHWGDSERSVVISHGLWSRRFGGDPGIIGRRIMLDAVPHTIVGVAPEGFTYPGERLDVWVPFTWYRSFLAQPWFRFAHFLRPVARLAPGVPPEDAHAEVVRIAADLAREHPETNLSYGAGLTPLKEWTVESSRRPLLVLLASVGLLLLVASANVAGLLVARSGARERELAMRSALGASRGRIVRQLLVENLLLAGAGGAGGIALGFLGTRLIVHQAASVLPRAGEIGLDGSVLVFAAVLSLATGLLFGFAPALHYGQTPSLRAIRRGEARVAGGRFSSARQALVLAEVALAVVLVAGAGLTLRSFASLRSVDPGFEPSGLVAASFEIPSASYGQDERAVELGRQVLERVRALPEVEAAALASSLPLEGAQWTADFSVEGRRPGEHGIDFARRIVSPGYFRTLGVPLLRGRSLEPADDERGRPVVVINESLARRHFRGEDPVGQRITFRRDPTEGSVWREIVGVVGDEKVEGLAAPGRTEVFVPLGQELYGEPGLAQRSLTLTARSRSDDPTGLTAAMRSVLQEIDATIPLFDVRTLDEVVADGAARERLLALLLGSFAAVAMVLSGAGLWGLVAYGVAQRRKEIGIRMALGATAGGVVGRIVAGGMILVAGGIALGLAAVLALSRGLESLLFEVPTADPVTLLAAVAVLACAALFAMWLPARRAAALDPLDTLREG